MWFVRPSNNSFKLTLTWSRSEYYFGWLCIDLCKMSNKLFLFLKYLFLIFILFHGIFQLMRVRREGLNSDWSKEYSAKWPTSWVELTGERPRRLWSWNLLSSDWVGDVVVRLRLMSAITKPLIIILRTFSKSVWVSSSLLL